MAHMDPLATGSPDQAQPFHGVMRWDGGEQRLDAAWTESELQSIWVFLQMGVPFRGCPHIS